MKYLLLAVVIGCININAQNKAFSPLQFCLKQEQSGIDKFWTLYKTHTEAKRHKKKVSYFGIDSLEIEIPKDYKSIPLSDETDFCGLILTVKCCEQDAVLFEMSQEAKPIEIEKKVVDDGYFKKYGQLDNGLFLLDLTDDNLWVKQRQGFDYGHQRKDLLLLKDGKALNKTIFPYNNGDTELSSVYSEVNPNKRIIENLTFVRKAGNTKIASFVLIDHQYNVDINNIKIKTPVDTLYGDQAIIVTNSYGVSFNDVLIDGTYSRPDAYGYGITMNNVCNVEFNRLHAHGNWGVFGNNNVSTVRLVDCDINRFDVHCYGKDILFTNCIFRDLYNQFSSMNGSVEFKKCEFYNFTPFQYETTYNAYTKFDLSFNDCKVYANTSKNYLIDARCLLGVETQERDELKKQQYPNLRIDGLTVYLDSSDRSYYIYNQGYNIFKRWNTKIPGVVYIKNTRVINSQRSSVVELSFVVCIVRCIKKSFCLVFIVILTTCIILYIHMKKKF